MAAATPVLAPAVRVTISRTTKNSSSAGRRQPPARKAALSAPAFAPATAATASGSPT